MAIIVTNPRRTRLTLTVAGPLLALGGLVLLGVGDMNALSAKQAAINTSAADWGKTLGFDVDRETELAAEQAREDADWAETQKSMGIAGMVVGVLVLSSRWAIRPEQAPQNTVQLSKD